MAEETSEAPAPDDLQMMSSPATTTLSAEAGPKEETPEQNGTTNATHPETAEDPDPILDQLFFAEEEDDLTGDAPLMTGSSTTQEQPQVVRQGTIASARFNMWATMVGGGSLSLPLAFQKTGNALGGPLILIATAFITEFCFRVLVDAARTLHPPSTALTTKGKDSYEGIAATAFGNRMLQGCTLLVTLMCFFGIVGYAVLLRDMLEPVTDAVFSAVKRSGWFPLLARQPHHGDRGADRDTPVHAADADGAPAVRSRLHGRDWHSRCLRHLSQSRVHLRLDVASPAVIRCRRRRGWTAFNCFPTIGRTSWT